MFTPMQLALSQREYKCLRDAIRDSITDDPRFTHSPVQRAKRQPVKQNQNAAAFRAASRVYLVTHGGLKTAQALLAMLSARLSAATAKPRKPMVANPRRLALSLATLLFLHRRLYQIFTGVRQDLLHEKVRRIRERWPKTYDLFTWRLTPAVAASFSGLALGICPKDQLRVTIAIYVLVRASEMLYEAAEVAGYLRNKPRWVGSWMFFALAHGQLLHSFVFNPDCFPEAYGAFISKQTPEYIQKRSEGLSPMVKWPTSRQIVDSLAEMARLKWPAYVSPILRPKDLTTLPPTINPIISPITSRAHPAIQHLSCALIHPSETSCFTPFLRQLLHGFVNLGRFMAMYYSLFSLIRIQGAFKQPVDFLVKLLSQVLKVTVVAATAIAGSWGSICFFNNLLPKSFIPQSRFFLGGAISGSVAILDRSLTGHENAMYVTRTSLDSLWKVGVKKRWWRGVKGGDVLLFCASLATLNMLHDLQRNTKVGQSRTMSVIKVLQGEIEVGLKNKDEKDA